MKPPAGNVKWLVAVCLVLYASILACNIGSQSANPVDPTLSALSQSVALTATAAAGDEGSSSDDLGTAQAEATQRSEVIRATQTANASTRDESQLATATVAAPVIAELPLYNVEPDQGQLGWMHDPVSLTIDGYHEYGFANDYMQVVARDFVMAADITWDTQYGASGCGFMFRSDGDKNKPNQYILVASRIGNGHVIFSALADGELANVHDFYANQLDTSFAADKGSTNRLAVVGRGTLFEIFTNGVKIGEVDVTQPPPSPVLPSAPQPPADQTNQAAVAKYMDQLKDYQDMVSQVRTNYQIALQNYKTTEAIFEEGFVAMIALSESGRTNCQFTDAWLWLIE